METRCQHLTLLKLLHIFEELFNVTLGTWKIDPYDLDLKEDVKPICLRPYPIPKVHEENFKKDVECLVLLEILAVANNTKWGAPPSAQPEPKSD